MTNSEAEAKKIEEKLAKVPEVLRTMSLDSFVPEDQPAKLKLIGQGAKVSQSRAHPDSIDARRPTPRISSFERIGGNLGMSPADAKGPARWRRGGFRRAVKACRLQSGHANKTQAIFVSPLKIMLDQLKNSLQAQPVNLQDAAGRSGEFVKPGCLIRVDALPRRSHDN